MLIDEALTEQIIGAAMEVHRLLGPGLMENVYPVCLAHELDLRGVRSQREKPLPIVYKGTQLDCGSCRFRIKSGSLRCPPHPAINRRATNNAP
ncbi:MAG: GxxExxY protein [Chloroflexi bacterium]|nr:GxxExxY protein [Chloroflexota bacterium]